MKRRVFLITVAPAAAMLGSPTHPQPAKVDEKEPQAVALGYVDDAAKAAVAKQPKYAAGQMCGSCALYSGKAGDTAGPCVLFGGRQVASKGWCTAWAKKA